MNSLGNVKTSKPTLEATAVEQALHVATEFGAHFPRTQGSFFPGVFADMTSIRSCTGISRPAVSRFGLTAWRCRRARLTFHEEIQDAVAARERLVLVVGPKGAVRITCGDGVGRPAPSAGRPPGRQGGHPDPAARRLGDQQDVAYPR
jgi:hypothetical protein